VICENLRENSILDTELVGIKLVEEMASALEASLVAYAGFVDGDLIAIWGVKSSSMVSGYGYLWMVTTKTADEHPLVLARYSRRVIDYLLNHYSLLHGFVGWKYERSIRWLKWLGFEIGEPERHDKVMVRPFVRRR